MCCRQALWKAWSFCFPLPVVASQKCHTSQLLSFIIFTFPSFVIISAYAIWIWHNRQRGWRGYPLRNCLSSVLANEQSQRNRSIHNSAIDPQQSIFVVKVDNIALSRMIIHLNLRRNRSIDHGLFQVQIPCPCFAHLCYLFLAFPFLSTLTLPLLFHSCSTQDKRRNEEVFRCRILCSCPWRNSREQI